jgi:hypothetical protein
MKSTISIIFITGKVAIKWAALLNGSGSLFRSIRLIIRWTGRNKRRKSPASAIMNFLERDEKICLFIGYEIFTVKFLSWELFIKIELFNNINNEQIPRFKNY